MTQSFPIVNAHNSWSRLEEVWLGDVYPASWYDHLSSEIRDVFYEITEKTKEDLNIIERKLQEFDVIVRRPCYKNIDDYVKPVDGASGEEHLVKPEITPRDTYATIGNTFFMGDWYDIARPWSHVLEEYQQQGAKIDNRAYATYFNIVGANIVRAGKDLYIDTHWTQQSLGATQEKEKQEFQDVYSHILKDYRVHFLCNGGHIDACFACLRPGVILCNKYFSDYEKTFPGWTLLKRFSPEFHSQSMKYRPIECPVGNHKWYLPGMVVPKAFNKHVIEFALDWVGDFTETYFEVNCLSIDENNVIVLGENEPLFRALEKHGITAHSVPFRFRTFWDGGLHCLTLDIRRRSLLEDYFPERRDQSPIFYTD